MQVLSLEGSKFSLERQRVTQKQSRNNAGVETMETGLRLGSHMFYRCHRHQYSIVEHCKTKKSCPVLNFARFNSLVCIVARSREKSRSHRFSLPLTLALAYRSKHFPLTFLVVLTTLTLAYDFSVTPPFSGYQVNVYKLYMY